MDLTPRVSGDKIATFIAQHFTEDVSQRPEFENGFMALRQRENLKLARKYGLPVNDDIKGVPLARMMENWWLEGRFPEPEAPEDVVTSMRSELQQMREELQKLRAEPEQKAEPEVSTVDMKWGELKKHATAKGIDVMSKTREQILAELE